MLTELALVLEIQKTNGALTAAKSKQYASWVMEEASKNDIDPWVFHSIVWVESRWTARVVRKEQDGSCSIGLGQINVRCDSKQVEVLQDPRENLKKMGTFLSGIKTTCKHDCAGLGWLKAYNGGDRNYVPKKVEPIVQRCHAAYVEPAVRTIPARVLSSRVPGQEENRTGN